jgi:hypothetical protein
MSSREILAPLLRLLLDTEMPFLVGYDAVRPLSISFDQYREAVDELVASGELRLWQTDWESGTRRELAMFPAELSDEYQALAMEPSLDHDPVGLGLTLVEEHSIEAQDEWTVDIDHRLHTFRIEASQATLPQALDQLSAQAPQSELVETARRRLTHLIEIEGRLVPRAPQAPSRRSG